MYGKLLGSSSAALSKEDSVLLGFFWKVLWNISEQLAWYSCKYLWAFYYKESTHLAFTYSKSTVEVSEQYVKYVSVVAIDNFR